MSEERKSYIPTRCARCGEFAQYRRPDGALACDSCQHVDEVPASTALAARPASAEPVADDAEPRYLHPCYSALLTLESFADGSFASARAEDSAATDEALNEGLAWLREHFATIRDGWNLTTPPAAAQDRERLDWLERSGLFDGVPDDALYAVPTEDGRGSLGEGNTLRAAIDAAMNAARAAGATDGK